MAAGPTALEEIDVEKHTARQISTLARLIRVEQVPAAAVARRRSEGRIAALHVERGRSAHRRARGGQLSAAVEGRSAGEGQCQHGGEVIWSEDARDTAVALSTQRTWARGVRLVVCSHSVLVAAM